MASTQQVQRKVGITSTEVDAYVKELQAGHDGSHSAPPITVESILSRIYAKFYNNAGQSPFPDGMPFALQTIPALAAIATKQARVTAYVQCAVATRPVVTVYELEREICAAENVQDFAEIGLGSSLIALPFIRQVFKLNSLRAVAPVTSMVFIQFLLYSPVARNLLESAGDAADTVRAFAMRYANGKYTSLQLGIHIQNFPWLNLIVRQEIAKFTPAFRSLMNDSVRRLEQNALIYERAIESIDAALAQTDSSDRIPTRTGRSLRFAIHATTAEAEMTSLPPACWGTSNGPTGGLCLYGVIQSEPFGVTNNDKKPPITLPAPCNDGHVLEDMQKCTANLAVSFANGTLFSSSTLSREAKEHPHPSSQPQPPAPLPLPLSHSRKRRRGEIIVGPPTEVIVPIESEVCPVLLTTQDTALPSHSVDDLSRTVSLSFQELLPLLHCAAALHPLSRPKLTSIRDFAFLLGQSGSRDPFQIKTETLSRLVISTDTPHHLYDLYRALAGETTIKPLGGAVLECLDADVADLVFLPLANSSSLLPMTAVNGSLSGFVLMSGHWNEKDLSNPWIFHPLQFIFDGQCDVTSGNATVAILDGKRLLCGLSQFDSQRLLSALAERGVLLHVPESWLAVDGIITRFVKESFQGLSKNEGTVALRALLLFWWFVILLADKKQRHQSTAILDGTFSSLSDTRWIPHIVSASDLITKSKMRVACWKKPSELFLYTHSLPQCGLESFLYFAPYNVDHLRCLLPQPILSTNDQQVWSYVETWMSYVPTRQLFQEMASELSMRLNTPSVLTVPLALSILCSMESGQSVSLSTLHHLFRILKSGTEDELGKVRGSLFIPLPESSRVMAQKNRDTFVIMEMARCDTVCWDLPEDDEIPFNRSLSFLGKRLRSFFIKSLGVSPVPTVTSWIFVARNCRRKDVTPSFSLTNLLLRLLSECCKSQYAHLMSLQEAKCSAANTASDIALKELTALVPQREVMAEYLFPLNERWHRPAEGIFFCGPYYDSVANFPFKCDDSSAPSLPVLVFSELPHFTVTAVLRRMGLMAIEDCTERTATFNRINIAQTAELHSKIGNCVPQVQAFLMAHHPQYYALVREQVHARLAHFSTALVGDPVLREVLRYQRHVYIMSRELRYLYVPQHNCLYGVDEDFSPVVGAMAIADIFLPLPDVEVQQSLSALLEQLLGGASGYSARTKMESLKTKEELLWVLSAAPHKRFRDHFPLGTDVFFSSSFTPANQRTPNHLAGSVWSAEGGMMRSPAQWDTELFDSPWNVIHAASHEDNLHNDDDIDSSDDEADVAMGQKIRFSTNRLKTRRSNVRRQRSGPALRMDMHRGDSQEYAFAAERFAYEKLCAEAPSDVEVVWVNKNGESGQPFDIVMTRKRGSSDPKEVVMYVEVKSTCTSNRREFEMSLREFLYAARFGRAYKICRVFCASTSGLRQMRMEQMDNIVNLWRRGKVTLTGQVKVMIT